MDEIKVRLLVEDMPISLSPEVYFYWVIAKLQEAGIPLDEYGDPTNGVIQRFDDPEDFGATIYVWNRTNS